jgi:hypothetical protein
MAVVGLTEWNAGVAAGGGSEIDEVDSVQLTAICRKTKCGLLKNEVVRLFACRATG